MKAGVRLHGVNAADNIWMTCCALHNWLLEVDGLNGEWNGEIGLHDFDETTTNIPFALRRLNSTSSLREYDSSGMGPGFVDNEEDVANFEEEVQLQENADEAQQGNNCDIEFNECNYVRNQSCNAMREKLITHLNILFEQGKIKWPKN